MNNKVMIQYFHLWTNKENFKHKTKIFSQKKKKKKKKKKRTIFVVVVKKKHCLNTKPENTDHTSENFWAVRLFS